MLLYMDDRFADHETGSHPECPDRIRRVNFHLRKSEHLKTWKLQDWQPAQTSQVLRLHDAAYLERLEAVIGVGGGRIESDTVVSAESFAVALLAAGATVDAVDQLVTSDAKRAACLVRPPGHHALKAAPMGFCLMNNAAIAARHAIDAHSLDRVMIIDFDVHHGNGTQDAVWTDPSIAFYSIHRWPFYPGTGAKTETGSGDGLGTVFNEPIDMGRKPEDILSAFTSGLTSFVEKQKPQLIIVSAGFDAHRKDPIGSLGLETEHFAEFTRVISELAKSTADGKIISVLEGGYNLDVLPECVETHLVGLAKCE